MKTVIYPAKDLEGSKALFTALLGQGPTSDTPYYVGFSVDGLEIGLNPYGTEPTCYWDVADINAMIATLVAAGGVVKQEPTDVGGGMLVASVTEPSGSVVGLRQS